MRLHPAIEYLTPADKLDGMGPTILEQRDQKLETLARDDNTIGPPAKRLPDDQTGITTTSDLSGG